MNIFCSHIHLNNFKSHEDIAYHFDKGINCIIGKNGVGKTNLLDAIYYSCMAKSYFVHSEHSIIQQGRDFFKLKTNFTTDDLNKEVVLQWSPTSKKELFINQIKQERLSELIGKFPIVFFSPNDSQLIYGSSEERRKFMDATLCQIDRGYLEALIKYNKVLAQRNAALKKMSETHNTDTILLEIYNSTLHHLATEIHEKRKSWINDFIQLFKTYYYRIGEDMEEVCIYYRSALDEHSMMQWFQLLQNTEIQAGRTLRGIHHDDLDFEIKNMSLKKSGSQGQQKTFLLALKLAQYTLLKEKKNRKPIFMFDDIFDKFDPYRMGKIFTLLAEEGMGQIFMTDSDKNRILPLIERNFSHYNIIEF